VRGGLDIVPVTARGSTGLYVRRNAGDQVRCSPSGPRVQETGCSKRQIEIQQTRRSSGQGHVVLSSLSAVLLEPLDDPHFVLTFC
jgi:hypothetical protein